MVRILEALDFKVEGDTIHVPSWRSDVEHYSDIAEEVARFYGYNNIPAPLSNGLTARRGLTDIQQTENLLGSVCRAAGYDEIITYSFISPSYYDKIRMPKDSPLRKSLKILNPLGEDTSIMRTTILPSMLEIITRNYNYRNKAVRLYELGKIYLPREDGLADEPKILCIGNNPNRQAIYGAALGLYNSRIIKLVNKKGMLKSSIIIDELPTIFIKGLDNLIATARSNKVAVLLGFQDFSQLIRDYTDKEAKVIINTVGNLFSGQVVGETAKTLSERFGKILQKRQSMTINRNDKSTSISTQMDSMIPPSKISGLTQGMFVGSVADNFSERIEQKIFHCEIVVDAAKIAEEEKSYQKIPVITNFVDDNGVDHMQEMVQANYNQIKEDVRQIVADELERIKNDPALCHLLELGKKD